ncbi:MAG: peptidoglycan DD-metalloendopeptidase family protein [Actinobacteria bacterium]|nr:peptidoglycan DD-metalloendopeptidase family protein [Actinomycetota bacterium]
MRRCVAALAVMVAAAVLVAPLAAPAGASANAGETEPVAYRPPVDAPLSDTFRPPPPGSPYGAGNRGIDYATEEGQAVVAAAPGEVVFAGRVGSSLHAVVLHADGLRTSYSFLREIAVRRGDRVESGDMVGAAGAGGLHFGARTGGDTYVDPLVLLGQREGRVRLVPDPDESRPLAEVVERRRLVDSLRGVVREAGEAAREGLDWLTDKAVEEINQRIDLALVLIHDAISLGLPPPVHLAIAALAWHEDQDGCTPAEVLVPPAPPGRRIAVLVGGLASSTGHSAVLDVRTDLLGYAPADVHQFNYRSDGQPYGPADTAGDIAAAGRLLAEQVARLRRAHPDAAIDVIGHSMGGLVARAAITIAGAKDVATVVTLATPHLGADLATAAVALDSTTSGRSLAEAMGAVELGRIDPNATSILQMAETSAFLARLPRHGWSASTRVVSVAARWDIFVPNTHSRLSGATNVVVTPGDEPSVDHHARLPGSAEATREIALALAGLGATCRAATDFLQDWQTAREASYITDTLSLTIAVGGIFVDARTKATLLKGLHEAKRHLPRR